MAPEENSVADENPDRSPAASPREEAKIPAPNAKRNNMGWLLVVLLTPGVIDLFECTVARAGPYSPVVFALGLGGFVGAAALGAAESVIIVQRPWWSSCRWAIYGLFGILLVTFIAGVVRSSWR